MEIGIDIGSVSAKCVILDGKTVVLSRYLENKDIIQTLHELLKDIDITIDACGVTGSGKDLTKEILGADIALSEIMAHAKGALFRFPGVRTIIDIGGEDSKLIKVEDGRITDFMMNRECGGGTGATIDAIAHRLGLHVSDVGPTALKANRSIALPGKCGVFCQSAVVSKKNMGVPKEDILYGVCKGMVQNYIAMFGKKGDLTGPIVFQGACAQNTALVRCFEDELGEEVNVPEECHLMGAIGAALAARECENKGKGFKGAERMRKARLRKSMR